MIFVTRKLVSDYWYLTIRQESEVLGVEILAHSWLEESGFNQFYHYINITVTSNLKGIFQNSNLNYNN